MEQELASLRASAEQTASVLSGMLDTIGVDGGELADENVGGRLRLLQSSVAAALRDEDGGQQIVALRAVLGAETASEPARPADADGARSTAAAREADARMLQKTREALTAAEAALSNAQSEADARLAEANLRLEQATIAAANLPRSLAVREVMLGNMRDTLSELEARDVHRQGELARLTARLAAAEDDLGAARGRLAELEARDAHHLSKLVDLQAGLSIAADQLEQTRSEVWEIAVHAIAADFRHLVHWRTDTAAARRQAAQARQSLAEARAKTVAVAIQVLAAMFQLHLRGSPVEPLAAASDGTVAADEPMRAPVSNTPPPAG